MKTYKYCPHCGRKIGINQNYCQYCGVDVEKFKAQNQQQMRQPIPPRQYPYKRHHYFRNIFIVIVLLIIGVGGYGMYKNCMDNQNATKVASQNSNPNNSSSSNNDIQKPKQNSQTKSVNNNNIAKQNSKKSTKLQQPVNKPGYTLAKFPKSIQGTWYTYDEGKLITLTITDNSITSNDDNYGRHVATSPLHARPIHMKNPPKHPNWMICMPPRKVRGLDLLQTLGWNQDAGDGESFGLINYNGMPVLEEDGGAESWVDSNFFRTKDQAKQNKKKTLPHEIKRSGM